MGVSRRRCIMRPHLAEDEGKPASLCRRSARRRRRKTIDRPVAGSEHEPKRKSLPGSRRPPRTTPFFGIRIGGKKERRAAPLRSASLSRAGVTSEEAGIKLLRGGKRKKSPLGPSPRPREQEAAKKSTAGCSGELVRTEKRTPAVARRGKNRGKKKLNRYLQRHKRGGEAGTSILREKKRIRRDESM